MARRYAKTAEVRRTVLEACISTFGESGFHGASMAEIARRAGISHTGLLHHFPSKDELLTAVLALQDHRSGEYLADHAALGPNGDPLSVLRGMVTILLDQKREAGLVELNAVLTAEATAPGHPAHGYFTERYRDVRRFLTRLFDELRERGQLASDQDSPVLAAMTLAMMDGLQTQWLYDRAAIDVDVIVAAHLRSLVPGVDEG